MQKSLNLENGRCISLWPHGILFRDKEAELRRKMIEEDLVECVIGLGPNLFYNSPMEACLLITKTNKEENKKGKILFINAVNEVKQEKTMGFLESNHIEKIFTAYQDFKDVEDFARLVDAEKVLSKNGNMAINLYVRRNKHKENEQDSFELSYSAWEASSQNLTKSMDELFQILEN